MYNKINTSLVAAQGAGTMSAVESEISNNVCVWIGLNDKADNLVGEITLNTSKVSDNTENWQETFWNVIKLANYANEIPSIVRNEEDKFDDMTSVATIGYASLDLFYAHYQKMVDELTQSPKFAEDCNTMNLDLQAVAQHIVYEGELMYSVVKQFGPKCFYRTMIERFNNPIYTLE